MELLAANVVYGLSLGSLYFLVATGLALIMGLMGIFSLVHGSLFMLGAYLSITVARLTGSFTAGILAGAGGAGIVGLAIERGFLRRLYKKYLDQILVTLGFVYIINNVHLWVYGGWAKTPLIPPLWAERAFIGDYGVPLHRIAIIVIGAIVFLGLWWFQERTKTGAIIRAGMDDKEMASGLGINLTPVTAGVFFLGAALAGFAGAVGTPLLGGINLKMDEVMLAIAIPVVIVGGMGSIKGAFIAALIIGVANALAATYFPQIDILMMYIIMVIILLARPSGLFGKKL